MSADADRKHRLDALTRAAAASLGPIASLLVDQAAGDGAPIDAVRRRVAAQVDESARAAFLHATRMHAAPPGAPTVPSPASQPPAALQPGPGTVDQTDPQLVQALVNELARHMGAAGESVVREAARRCRTKTQLYMRLAAAVTDADLKAVLVHRAATDISTRAGAS
jgi:hypothetical protein